ncbi:S1 family peptidase [Streptomyces kronopolitis]|uniref:S1 family peptidase n=1 Tax=Streptomyces kronopolitis TaxID=1612435 RepID=UPI0020BEBADC|nr:S1 family peptidase [Streptomyces kronopolitis]MCL6299855.1 S1 family peptidase [Streptomyces kronopolitis]
MKHTSAPTPRTLLAGAGAVALLAAALTLPSAQAAPVQGPDPQSSAAAVQRAKALSAALGPRGAGAYYDARNHRLVVNVTDRAAAGTVRVAGAEPRVVRHSLASLDAARATLREKATIPGTAWAMDPKANRVIVIADRTVQGAKLRQLTTVVSSLGDRAALQRSAGALRPMIAGGDAIWGPGARCSLGFNVTKGGESYFLTAGHCTSAMRTWSDTQGGPEIAKTVSSNFPGSDFGLARYTDDDIEHPSAVDLYDGDIQEITEADDPIVGQRVSRSGSTTHLREGDVLAVDATANYQEGTVNGLIQTSICAEAGDSGGALFEDEAALGLTSGGRGDCATAGQSYYQPVREALEETGTHLG